MSGAAPSEPAAGRQLDLRILTPGLADEEIAAVTSVVAAAIETRRAMNEDRGESLDAANGRRWRRSVGPFSGPGRGFGRR